MPNRSGVRHTPSIRDDRDGASKAIICGKCGWKLGKIKDGQYETVCPSCNELNVLDFKAAKLKALMQIADAIAAL